MKGERDGEKEWYIMNDTLALALARSFPIRLSLLEVFGGTYIQYSSAMRAKASADMGTRRSVAGEVVYSNVEKRLKRRKEKSERTKRAR